MGDLHCADTGQLPVLVGQVQMLAVEALHPKAQEHA